MPFIENTPESLVGRSDSKNPGTTCRGITSGGRPCRRPLAASSGSATPWISTKLGRLRVDDPSDEGLYCWQHKEQASQSARSSPGPRASSTPILEELTSLDTLADRLGIIAAARFRKAGKAHHKPQKPAASHAHSGGGGRPSAVMTRPKPKNHIFCCCFAIPLDEISPPPRPKPQVIQPMREQKHSSASQRPSLSVQSQHTSSTAGRAASQTSQYLSLIPAGASPQTASLLMVELAKPVSQLDEPGYIYMFWLTAESQQSAPPSAETARSLLAPPTTTRPGAGQRRVSAVMASFAAETETAGGSRTAGSPSGRTSSNNSRQPTKKILLKIGRANNVQRRLNEWTRQCGYDVSLIRYYPYLSSSDAALPGALPRKMPHSHKVERLIHIELAGAGLRHADRGKCDACGREHREWFQVEASRRGVTEVDEIIRRWVDWNERSG